MFSRVHYLASGLKLSRRGGFNSSVRVYSTPVGPEPPKAPVGAEPLKATESKNPVGVESPKAYVPPPVPNSTVRTIPAEVDYGTVKRVLLSTTFTTKLWYTIALIAGTVAIILYLMDKSNTPERLLASALHEIDNDVISIKKDGFRILNEALFATKRVFSGRVGLPVGTTHLASHNVVEALFKNIHCSDPEVAEQATEWILKLSSPEVLPKNHPKVRSIMFSVDPGLVSLSKLLVVDDYSASSKTWILASQIFSRLSDEEFSQVSRESLQKGLVGMAFSLNPAATALSASLYSRIPEHDRDFFGSEFNAYMNNVIAAQNNHPVKIRDVEEINDNLRKVRRAVGPTASVWSIVFFSAFASLWGRVLWPMSITFSPTYQKVIAPVSQQTRGSLRQEFLKSRAVGTAVFTLLSFDYLASRYLQDPLYYPDEALSFTRLPSSTLIPVVQTSLFTLGTLLAIRTQRFVIIPLMLAAAYNHWDLLDPVAKEYCPVISHTHREVEQELSKIRKEIGTWLKEEL